MKSVTAVLHAPEDVQWAGFGDSEELSRRCECSGTWLVRSTRSERRGCHRVSTEVFFAIKSPVENFNKELCGLVRCLQVASKTSPGSSSPEITSATIKRGAEHGKTRLQCKGCTVCDRQSGKTRRRNEVMRHSIRSLDTVEGSQTAKRRYLQLLQIEHITAFQKTSRREEVTTPSTIVDGTASDLRSS